MKIVRGRLNPAQVSDPAYRYDSDCACIQYSPDGGTTWNNAPGSDPRNAPQFRFPARTGSDISCNCAANARAWIKDVIDRCTAILEVGGVVVALANQILSFAEIIFAEAGGWLLNLILDVAGTLFGIGYSALSGAFDTTQYELLLCALFCTCDTAGQWDDMRFAALQSQITATMNTTAAFVVNLFLSIQGQVGLSNAGAIGDVTADCSGCSCCDTYTVTYFAGRGDGVMTNPTTVEPGGTYTFTAEEFPGFPGAYSLAFCLSCCLEVTAAAGSGSIGATNHVLCGAEDYYHGELVGECFQRINYGTGDEGGIFSITLTFGEVGCGTPSSFGCEF